MRGKEGGKAKLGQLGTGGTGEGLGEEKGRI